MICRHCARSVRNIQARGLCYRCYGDRDIREMYPKSPVGPGQRFGAPAPREPTLAELDVMIAEQMKCLPDWWDRESDANKE